MYYVVIILITYLTNSRSINIAEPCQNHNKTLPIPLALHQIVYFPNSSSVYIFGGINQTGINTNTTKPDPIPPFTSRSVYSKKIYKWNMLQSDSWFELIETKTPAHAFYSFINVAITIGNKAYFIGVDDGYSNHDKIYIFNSLTDSFVNTSNLSKPTYPVQFGCATTNETHIFIVGGFSNTHLQIYDIDRDYWISQNITVSPINTVTVTGYNSQYCQIVNDILYIFGGYTRSVFDTYTNPDFLGNSYKYDLVKQTWQSLKTKLESPDAFVNGADDGAALYYDSYILIIGVHNAYGPNADIVTFNTNNYKFGNTYSFLDAVSSLAALLLDDKLYIFGGLTSKQSVVSSVQICSLSSEYNQSKPADNHVDNISIFLGILCSVIFAVILYIWYRKLKKRKMNRLDLEEPLISK